MALEYWALATLCGVEQGAPPIFGRAAITLGIGPHSSSILVTKVGKHSTEVSGALRFSSDYQQQFSNLRTACLSASIARQQNSDSESVQTQKMYRQIVEKVRGHEMCDGSLSSCPCEEHVCEKVKIQT